MTNDDLNTATLDYLSDLIYLSQDDLGGEDRQGLAFGILDDAEKDPAVKIEELRMAFPWLPKQPIVDGRGI